MSALDQVAALIHRESGIAIKPSGLPSLSAAIERAAPGCDAEGLLAAVADRARRPALIERLIEEVTIKETFFFRHSRELAAIEWAMLWSDARRSGRDGVRVWSAACATGEEPYTLAIMACEAFGSAAPPVTILGTDLSRAALDRAQRGEYGLRALQEVDGARRQRWFEVSGRALAVAPPLRRLVRLRRHNLVRESIPPPGEDRFDLIVCRNVLIYFDRETVHATLSALEAALQPPGMLVIGAADRLSGPLPGAGHRRPVGAAPAGARRPQRRPPGRAEPRARAARAARDDASAAARDDPSATPRDDASAATQADASETARAAKLEGALQAVHDWSLEATIEQTGALVARDPLNVDAHFVQGVARLAAGDPAGAVASLRMALYLDPDFGLAAFKLARAHEAVGDPRAARGAYLRALHSLRPDDARNSVLLGSLDVADIAIACRDRLAKLDER